MVLEHTPQQPLGVDAQDGAVECQTFQRAPPLQRHQDIAYHEIVVHCVPTTEFPWSFAMEFRQPLQSVNGSDRVCLGLLGFHRVFIFAWNEFCRL